MTNVNADKPKTLMEDSYKGAVKMGLCTTAALSSIEARFQLLKREQDTLHSQINMIDSWQNGGFPPKAVLYSLGIIGSFALGGAWGACQHIARSVFPKN